MTVPVLQSRRYGQSCVGDAFSSGPQESRRIVMFCHDSLLQRFAFEMFGGNMSLETCRVKAWLDGMYPRMSQELTAEWTCSSLR